VTSPARESKRRATPEPPAKKAPNRTAGRRLWDNLKGIAIPVAIFLVVRAFVIEAYRIPSGSMEPALLIGDWLFVNKFIYGAHVPWTDHNFPAVREPRRGDVVVFISPPQRDEEAAGKELTPILVKRLIGVAGDTLYMRDGVLYRNGEKQDEPYVNGNKDGDSVDPLFDWQKPVQLPESRFGPPPSEPSHDNWGPLVVPVGHLWMMGDNRYNSKDSRYWGFVPRENVRGEPMFVYYSYRGGEESDRPLPFLTDIRWGRIGHWIK
jgi:signal peptidase I